MVSVKVPVRKSHISTPAAQTALTQIIMTDTTQNSNNNSCSMTQSNSTNKAVDDSWVLTHTLCVAVVLTVLLSADCWQSELSDQWNTVHKSQVLSVNWLTAEQSTAVPGAGASAAVLLLITAVLTRIRGGTDYRLGTGNIKSGRHREAAQQALTACCTSGLWLLLLLLLLQNGTESQSLSSQSDDCCWLLTDCVWQRSYQSSYSLKTTDCCTSTSTDYRADCIIYSATTKVGSVSKF